MIPAIEWQSTPASRLGEFQPAWDALNGANADLPILDADFWQIALRCFGSGDERLLLGTRDDEAIVAGLFSPARRLASNLFQPSQAPLGPWLLSRAHAGDPEPLLASLQRVFGKRCAAIGITQQDPRCHQLPSATPGLLVSPHIRTAALQTVGNFDEFWQTRSKNLRKNMRRQHNHLEREGVDARLEILDAAAAMPAAVADFAALEQSGWKAETGTAVTAAGEQGIFYSDLLRHYADRNEALVYQYFFDDTLVASDLCIRRGGTIIVLKTAYDAAIRQLSPGILMKEEIFRRLFDSPDIRRVEFYGRVMERHLQWTDDIRELYHLTYLTGLARTLRRARGWLRPAAAKPPAVSAALRTKSE